MAPPEPQRPAGSRKAADSLPTLTEVLDWRSAGAELASAVPVLHTEATPPLQTPATGAPDALEPADRPSEKVAVGLAEAPAQEQGVAPESAAAQLPRLEPALEAAIHHAVDAALVHLLHELKPQLAAALRVAVAAALVKALEQAGTPRPLPPKT